jgi:hypothetical protein
MAGGAQDVLFFDLLWIPFRHVNLSVFYGAGAANKTA